MADVKVENITKRYDDLVALNKVSFECKEGQFFTLLGPSGAGKTTMLELIAGIKEPTEGHVYIGGQMVNKLPPQERNVAMAFENYALYSFLSVYDNIAFPLRSPKMKGLITSSEERQRVQEMATLLGIEKLLDRRPQHLSGGQKQRVSLARTMVRRPDVYLLDEPIAHLDAKLRTSTRATLKELAKEFGITIIYVTHNYREALALSDHILILREGIVEQIDTPENIYHVPASDFTAKLTGDPPINLIDGEVLGNSKGVFFSAAPHFSFPIASELTEKLKNAQWEENDRRMVRIGIRPQDIKISRERISDMAFDLPVYATIREGENSVITFELKDVFLLVRTDSDHYKVGEKLWIQFDQQCMFFFRKTMDISK
jgi:multiple sugar transport system ATP-binding protein